jgi:hypothetical protein
MDKQKLKIFNPDTYTSSYQLPVPAGWSVERFALPPEFAKQIEFKGVEDVRFAPGWGEVKTDEYWSYAFLWWTEGIPQVNSAVLEKSLVSYYSGLTARNITPRKIPESKLVPIAVSVHAIETGPGDLETYAGKISMLDYMTQTPMILNALIHKKSCPDKNHGFIFFEISPRPLKDPVWEKLNKLNVDFECMKP